MRQSKTLSVALMLPLLFTFIGTDNRLVGHWVTAGKDKADLYFTNDGHFKVMVGKDTENEGSYTLKQDTFSMYDSNCGLASEGKYRLQFFTKDSVQFRVIADACKDRRGEIDGGTITRVKE